MNRNFLDGLFQESISSLCQNHIFHGFLRMETEPTDPAIPAIPTKILRGIRNREFLTNKSRKFEWRTPAHASLAFAPLALTFQHSFTVLCRARDNSNMAIPVEHPSKSDAKNGAKKIGWRPFGRNFAIGFGSYSASMAMSLFSPAPPLATLARTT